MVLVIQDIVFGCALFIFSFAWLLILNMRSKTGHGPQIRRLEALDGIDKAVARCRELGRKFALGNEGATTGGGSAPVDTAAGFGVLDYAIRACVRDDVEPLVTLYSGMEQPSQYLNMLETDYTSGGKADKFRSEMLQVPSNYMIAAVTALAGLFRREHPAAACYQVASYMGAVIADGIIADGGVVILATAGTSNVSLAGLVSDYSFLGEELYAAGAMMSKDTMTISSLGVQDMSKFIFLGFVAVYLVSWIAHLLPSTFFV